MKKNIIIAGAGHAGGRCALQLREKGFSGEITMIGNESSYPYERPPLSKGVLQDPEKFQNCLLAEDEKWRELDIRSVLSTSVERINLQDNCVTIHEGAEFSYDKLVLATGGVCRRLSCSGEDLKHIFQLRTAQDSFDIAQHLSDGAQLVIIGGGFIGLEVAASARALGCQVTIVENQNRLLGRVFAEPISSRIQSIHEAQGVKFVFNDSVARFSGVEKVEGVVLESGTSIDADLVVVGVGIVPNTNLAEHAGLAIDNGVVANQYCQTSVENIYAIGDCANALNTRLQQNIRLESWQNAEHQASIVANHILGIGIPWDSLPWFWSDQYHYNIQMAGLPSNKGDIIQRGDLSDGAVIYFEVEGDRLISAVAIGEGTKAARDLRVSQMIMQQGKSISADMLLDTSIKLKSLLK